MDMIYLSRANNAAEPITLAPGTPLRLEHTVSGQTATTLFVGGRQGQHLVILPPHDQKGRVVDSFVQQDVLQASYMLDESMIRFTMVIQEMIDHPIELVLLSFPDDADSFELRSHKRINCFLASTIEVHSDTSKEVHKGTIRDISKTGCRCNFTEMDNHCDIFATHDHITIRCKFPGIADEQETVGIVRDIRVDQELVSIGIKFLETAWWVPPYD